MTLSDMQAVVDRLDPFKMAMRECRFHEKRADDLLQDALSSGAMANEVRVVILFNSAPRRHDGIMRTELR